MTKSLLRLSPHKYISFLFLQLVPSSGEGCAAACTIIIFLISFRSIRGDFVFLIVWMQGPREGNSPGAQVVIKAMFVIHSKPINTFACVSVYTPKSLGMGLGGLGCLDSSPDMS